MISCGSAAAQRASDSRQATSSGAVLKLTMRMEITLGARVAYPRTSAQSSDDALRPSASIFRSLGISYVQGTVRGPAGAEAAVRFLIDSGATYSLLPEPVWRAIGIVPKREMEFVLADGTTVRRAVSECYLTLPQGDGHKIGRASCRERG